MILSTIEKNLKIFNVEKYCKTYYKDGDEIIKYVMLKNLMHKDFTDKNIITNIFLQNNDAQKYIHNIRRYIFELEYDQLKIDEKSSKYSIIKKFMEFYYGENNKDLSIEIKKFIFGREMKKMYKNLTVKMVEFIVIFNKYDYSVFKEFRNEVNKTKNLEDLVMKENPNKILAELMYVYKLYTWHPIKDDITNKNIEKHNTFIEWLNLIRKIIERFGSFLDGKEFAEYQKVIFDSIKTYIDWKTILNSYLEADISYIDIFNIVHFSEMNPWCLEDKELNPYNYNKDEFFNKSLLKKIIEIVKGKKMITNLSDLRLISYYRTRMIDESYEYNNPYNQFENFAQMMTLLAKKKYNFKKEKMINTNVKIDGEKRRFVIPYEILGKLLITYIKENRNNNELFWCLKEISNENKMMVKNRFPKHKDIICYYLSSGSENPIITGRDIETLIYLNNVNKNKKIVNFCINGITKSLKRNTIGEWLFKNDFLKIPELFKGNTYTEMRKSLKKLKDNISNNKLYYNVFKLINFNKIKTSIELEKFLKNGSHTKKSYRNVKKYNNRYSYKKRYKRKRF
jgi:hypothetical protein